MCKDVRRCIETSETKSQYKEYLELLHCHTCNSIPMDVPFSLTRYWPILAEIAMVVFAFDAVASGHVDKRY
jgi:hypothetical protein